MRLAVQERSAVPREFDILLRVAGEPRGAASSSSPSPSSSSSSSSSGDNWCLVSRDMGRAEADEAIFLAADTAAEHAGTDSSDEPLSLPAPLPASAAPLRVEEWHREAVVLRWMAQQERDRGDVGFIIDPAERADMPAILQVGVGIGEG